MSARDSRYDAEQRLLAYLQSSYNHALQWITPLPWKSNVKFLFDQVYMKDIRFSQEVYCDNVVLLRSCAQQFMGNDFLANLLNGLKQLDMRLATVQGKMGCGKSIFLQKILRDWSKRSLQPVKNHNRLKYFLYCQITESTLREFSQFDEDGVSNLFNIPDYLYEEFVWLIENCGENFILFLDIDDINRSSRLLFKLYHKIFPNSKFVIFHRPDVSDNFKELPQTQELFYLLRRRIEVKLHDFETRQILTLVKQTFSNSILYQTFRDALHENVDLKRLCRNPFLCVAILSHYKDSKGMKFAENKLSLVRKCILTIWKRYSTLGDNQSDSDIIRHIDSLLITFSQGATECHTRYGGLFTEEELLSNEHTHLLLDTGLLMEKILYDVNVESLYYTFFDPLLHEYACALYYAKLIIERPDESAAVANVLFSMEWRNVCILVAGLLGKKFNLIVEEMNFEDSDDQILLILSECLHQCQCATLVMRNIKKFELPQVLDFSEYNVTSSTFKGLQFLVEWSQESSQHASNIDNNTAKANQYENKRHSLQLDYKKLALERYFNNHPVKQEKKPATSPPCTKERWKKYNSCPDLNQALSAIAATFVDQDEEDLSWSGHYKAHMNRQTSVANLHSVTNRSKSVNTSPNRITHLYGSQQWLNDLSEGALSRAESTYSIFSSMEGLSVKIQSASIKELRIKGNGLSNRTFTSLIAFLRLTQLKGLYLMDQQDEKSDVVHPISDKLVKKFLEVVQSLSDLTLNSNHLGMDWTERLCQIIEGDFTLKYVGVSVMDLDDLTVENAFKLVKSMKHNKSIEQMELYCGVQSIVVQASLGFYADILEKDDRLNVTFL